MLQVGILIFIGKQVLQTGGPGHHEERLARKLCVYAACFMRRKLAAVIACCCGDGLIHAGTGSGVEPRVEAAPSSRKTVPTFACSLVSLGQLGGPDRSFVPSLIHAVPVLAPAGQDLYLTYSSLHFASQA